MPLFSLPILVSPLLGHSFLAMDSLELSIKSQLGFADIFLTEKWYRILFYFIKKNYF